MNTDDDNLMTELSIHPVGRIEGDNIYITDPKSVNEDGSITYYARIYNLTRMSILELDDIKKVWKATRDNCRKKVKKPSFSIAINCCGRSKTFEDRKLMNSFVSTVSSGYGNLVTLSGFGEQLNCSHFNQTLVLAIFE